jgi:hypothetical protein
MRHLPSVHTGCYECGADESRAAQDRLDGSWSAYCYRCGVPWEPVLWCDECRGPLADCLCVRCTECAGLADECLCPVGDAIMREAVENG